MPRGRQFMLRMAVCRAALLLTTTPQSAFSAAGEDYAQLKHQDFPMMLCSTRILKHSPHVEVGRPVRERALQVSQEAITQAPGVPRGARTTTDLSESATPPSNSSTQAAGGFCEAYMSRHANGSTIWCSVRPARGRVCPLGLGFSAWTCRDGIWVPAAIKKGEANAAGPGPFPPGPAPRNHAMSLF
jgi:hypothetical protein